MEVIYPRCAGLDVHKDTVVVCVRIASGDDLQQVVKTFATHTKGLLELADWLISHGCSHVAMESTGVYWKPVWHVLEGSFELILANAMHLRNVPGHKTDVNDATWIAPLFVYTLGLSLAMPNLTLFALDPFPDNRGMAASCQTFMQSGFNGVVAALIAPAVWGSTLSLAGAMAGFLILGGLTALLYRRSVLLPR